MFHVFVKHFIIQSLVITIRMALDDVTKTFYTDEKHVIGAIIIEIKNKS